MYTSKIGENNIGIENNWCEKFYIDLDQKIESDLYIQ